MAHDKRLNAARATVDRNKNYALVEAVALAKSNAKAKFDETIEIALNLGIDPRHADQMVRGLISLPNGTGKVLRVGVFARGAKADEALAAGADVVGADDLAEKVQAVDIQFDRCIATPDMMALVGKLGKILGPRGLMPNPKLGTVTPNVVEAIKAAKAGSIEFRAEKAVVSTIHLKHIVDMAPRELWGEEFLRNMEVFRPDRSRALPSPGQDAENFPWPNSAVPAGDRFSEALFGGQPYLVLERPWQSPAASGMPSLWIRAASHRCTFRSRRNC